MSSRNRSFVLLPALVLFAATLLSAADRGEGPLDPAQPVGITPQQIIDRFAAREKEFSAARDQYTYRESVKVQTLDDDTPTGEFQETFDVLFDDQGKRILNMVYAPPSTLEQGGLNLDEEDIRDFEQLQPFVLTSDDLAEYDITYAGRQREDELNTYVFDIKPKLIDKVKRRFQGRVWVDDHDFQIVKAYGKGVSAKNFEKGHAFPDFTTYREQIDAKYWFPTYTIADEVMHFPGGKHQPDVDVHLREVVKYSNYKQFGSQHRIIYAGQEVESSPQQPGQKQPPPSQPQPQNPQR